MDLKWSILTFIIIKDDVKHSSIRRIIIFKSLSSNGSRVYIYSSYHFQNDLNIVKKKIYCECLLITAIKTLTPGNSKTCG